MKKWLFNASNKYGKYAINDLMLYISAATMAVFLMDMLSPGIDFSGFLTLSIPSVLQGQVWRLLTFIFVSPSSGLLFVGISLYFYYYLAKQIELVWGSFRFNLYYLVGVLGILLSAFITGWGTVEPLNLSIFLAFATLFPDNQIMYNFFLPIKGKHLAILYLLLILPRFVAGGWGFRLSIVISLLNFILFLGKDFLNNYTDDFFMIKHKLGNFFGRGKYGR